MIDDKGTKDGIDKMSLENYPQADWGNEYLHTRYVSLEFDVTVWGGNIKILRTPILDCRNAGVRYIVSWQGFKIPFPFIFFQIQSAGLLLAFSDFFIEICT